MLIIINTGVLISSIYFVMISFGSWKKYKCFYRTKDSMQSSSVSDLGALSIRTNGSFRRSNSSRIEFSEFRESMIINNDDKDFCSVSSDQDEKYEPDDFCSVSSNSMHNFEHRSSYIPIEQQPSSYVPIELKYCDKGLLVPIVVDENKLEVVHVKDEDFISVDDATL